jgi:RNA polymerase-binding transcription factor DksA
MLSALPRRHQLTTIGRQQQHEDAMETDTPTTAARKLCSLCGQPIAPARLEALPGVTTCIACAKKHPRKVDVSGVDLSQASPINRNGFAPKD